MIRDKEAYDSKAFNFEPVLPINAEIFKVNDVVNDLSRGNGNISIPIIFVTKDIYKVLKSFNIDLRLKPLTKISKENFLKVLSKYDIDMLSSINSLFNRYISKELNTQLSSIIRNNIDIDSIKFNLTKDDDKEILIDNASEYIETIHIDGTIVCIISPFLNTKEDTLKQIENLSECLIKIIVNELFKQYDEKIVYSMWNISH